ncbi:MAG TPA: hypothetical protein VFQ45_02020 [Longimicrobium sp.]|nr:hypothetical protein [Longimicrobium sp.]
MRMDVQTLLVMMIVAAAAVYVGGRWRRTLLAARAAHRKPGCGPDCGCGE